MKDKAKVKLPHLPGSEPEGSIAEYLAQTSKRNSNGHPSLANPTDSGLSVPDSTAEQLSNANPNFNDKTAGAASQQGDLNEAVARPPGASAVAEQTENHPGMSKILDISVEANPSSSGRPLPQLLGPPVSAVALPGVETSRRPVSKGHRGDEKPTTSRLINVLVSLPRIHTTHAFKKGEMKIRLTPEMGNLLRMLNDQCNRIEPISYLPENLVHSLLRRFFTEHAHELDTLNKQAHLLEQTQQQQRYASLKHLLETD